MPQEAREESFANRVALVAGARGNLGRAVARRLVTRGATTVLVDRNGAGLIESFGDLAAAGTHLLAGDVDLLDAGALTAVVAQAVARWGRLDIAINTVGGFRAGEPAHDTALTTWETMLDLNLRSTLALARAVVPTMLEQKQGKIVTVAARAALAGGACRRRGAGGVLGRQGGAAEAHGEHGRRAQVVRDQCQLRAARHA